MTVPQELAKQVISTTVGRKISSVITKSLAGRLVTVIIIHVLLHFVHRVTHQLQTGNPVFPVVQTPSIMTARQAPVKLAVSTTADRLVTNALKKFPTGIVEIV